MLNIENIQIEWDEYDNFEYAIITEWDDDKDEEFETQIADADHFHDILHDNLLSRL